MSNKLKRVCVVILYILPIIFFGVAYFGITTSGEDIHQGAGNLRNGELVDVLTDSKEAFLHNGRLTDVYAWTVIDFFDYQFRFGPDVVFRLLDVVMASGIFYIMTMLVLRRRPKLEIKDSLIFCASFLMVILTQHGRVLYSGFSAIHNYMVAIFIMLVFLLPYVMSLSGKFELDRKTSRVWFALGMLFLGVVFGMSAAIPPIAFVVVMAGYLLVRWKRKKKVEVQTWAWAGLIGVIGGILISNVLGPGTGFYTTNDLYVSEYDYLPLGEIFSNLFDSVLRILRHMFYNFGRVLLPIVAVALCAFVFIKDSRGVLKRSYWKKMGDEQKKLIILGISFMVLNILGASQVNAPIRILLPAYIMGAIIVMMIFNPYIKYKIVCAMVLFVAVVVVGLKIGLTVNYHMKMRVVLDEIEGSSESVMCVERERVKAYNLPVVYLGQEDMLVDWAMPEKVYGRLTEFCE